MHPPLSCSQAASLLGIAAETLRRWLRRSDKGLFRIHGQPVLIAYGQTGAGGQGRICLTLAEVDRLKELMQVHPDTSSFYVPLAVADTVVVGGETISLGRLPK